MPTYEYECTTCGQHIEVFQRFSEDALTTCGNCGGTLRKVFHPAGIVFKGSGFYATDSRSKRSSGAGQKKDGESSGSAGASPKKDASGSPAAASSDGGSSGSSGGDGSASKTGAAKDAS